MDFQKEKHEYLSMLVDHGAITQEQSDSLSLLNSNIGLHSNSLTSSLVDCINWGWQSWLKAKAQANKQFEDFIDQAIEDSACAEERQTLQRLLEELQEQK